MPASHADATHPATHAVRGRAPVDVRRFWADALAALAELRGMPLLESVDRVALLAAAVEQCLPDLADAATAAGPRGADSPRSSTARELLDALHTALAGPLPDDDAIDGLPVSVLPGRLAWPATARLTLPASEQAPGVALAHELVDVVARLEACHPDGLKAAVAKLRGATEREIGQRLDLGPRLVQRILAELARAVESPPAAGS